VANNIPCILITDRGHHDEDTEWINQMASFVKHYISLVDEKTKDGGKDWNTAFRSLLYRIEPVKFLFTTEAELNLFKD